MNLTTFLIMKMKKKKLLNGYVQQLVHLLAKYAI